MRGIEEIRGMRRPEESPEEIRELDKTELDPPMELDVSLPVERTLVRPENAPTKEPMITPSTPAATAAIPPAVASSLAPIALARASLAAAIRSSAAPATSSQRYVSADG